ncbi:MAG: hypothetical protein AAB593_02415 [Patescibacteria group bacterium]
MEKSPYSMSIQEASKVLNKASRSVHRYIVAKKLSKIYIHTENGKEVRLKPEEVKALNRELHGLGPKIINSDNEKQKTMQDIKSNKDSFIAQELLSRYEQAMFRLGQLNANEKQVLLLEEKTNSMRSEIDILKHKNFDLEKQNQEFLNNTRRAVNELDDIRQRKLSFIERFIGRIIDK